MLLALSRVCPKALRQEPIWGLFHLIEMWSFESHTPIIKESKKQTTEFPRENDDDHKGKMRLMLHNGEKEKQGRNTGDPGILP